MKTLSIRVSHIKKLRSVMKGESDMVEENRSIPKILRLEVWLRDKGKCTQCGAKDKMHYHHIKRFSDGGLHTKDNIKLLCAPCHAEEHKGEPSYYMLKKLAEEG
jgi:5-methylcytosine-specific restriction endonuclease McrA